MNVDGEFLRHAGTWFICGLSVFGIVVRPRGSTEVAWAVLGAFALVTFGLIAPHSAFDAIAQGIDVYAFLAGMMLLAELLRSMGFFDWIATAALALSRGSPVGLLAIVYGVGIVITALLSNDATAVVLTPAIVAVLEKTEADPLPYAFAGAMIANAASFVLPISNPANLVVYNGHLPSLLSWLDRFALASILSIIVTFIALVARWRSTLSQERLPHLVIAKLDRSAAIAAVILAISLVALCTVSFLGGDIGEAAFIVGVVALGIGACADRQKAVAALRHVHWGVIPFVAGLFVIVTALDQTGALSLCAHLVMWADSISAPIGALGIAAFVTVTSAILNNLPIALVAPHAFDVAAASRHIRDAWLVAVDLGPNLAASGSLATLLWMAMLRRDGIHVSARTFLSVGIVVLPPALIAAILVTR